MGIPVVTTPIGVEGIDAIDGKHVLVADSPIEFARAVIHLLRDGLHATALAKSARAVVEREYGWSAVTARLLEAYDQRPAPLLQSLALPQPA
jgi:glycosyltransferase involved in cell wall biosynthesis